MVLHESIEERLTDIILTEKVEQEMLDVTRDRFEEKYGFRRWYTYTNPITKSSGLLPKDVIDMQYYKMQGKIVIKDEYGNIGSHTAYSRISYFKNNQEENK